MNGHDEQATVAQRRTGFNGLPEPEDLDADVAREVLGTSAWPSRAPAAGAAAFAAWAAVAAVAAVMIPAAFAVRALLRHSGPRRDRGSDRRLSAARRGAVDTDVTPPHGDKLLWGPGAR